VVCRESGCGSVSTLHSEETEHEMRKGDILVDTNRIAIGLGTFRLTWEASRAVGLIAVRRAVNILFVCLLLLFAVMQWDVQVKMIGRAVWCTMGISTDLAKLEMTFLSDKNCL